MKNLISNHLLKLTFIGFILMLSVSCQDEFLVRPPESEIVLDEFYNTEDQVNAATNILYGQPWYQFNNFFIWTVGDIASGNLITWDPKTVAFVTWDVSGDNQRLTEGWSSLWSVIAQANATLNALPDRVDPSVSQATVDNALAEARFMRAVAYFYLVRVWGNVPIIENNLDYVYDSQLNTNPVEDVYKFIVMDLEYAAQNLRDKSSQLEGHVSKNAAHAFLAKVYLTQKQYDLAKQHAGVVIASGDYILLDSYNDLFKTENDNNDESILQLQWIGNGPFGTGNATQAYFAYSSTVTGTGDGWGAVGPSIDLQRDYEANDRRRTPTIANRGNFYSDLNNGTTIPNDINVHGGWAGLKKYVVGRPEFNGGGTLLNAANNTYIMRYADVLLTYAEAALGSSSSTSDAQALAAFNEVRERAGLPAVTIITTEDILHERRIEFAAEGQYWYDLLRVPRSMAIDIMANQERGTYDNADNSLIYDRAGFRSPTEDDFIFPYPNVDVLKNPNLLEPPVPYDF